MRRKGLEPNVVIYNTAISACVKAKPSQKVLELLEQMLQKGLELKVIMCNAAIGAC